MSAKLSVRTLCEGGELSTRVRASQDLRGVARLTLLIHGFNVSECDAWQAYGQFGRRSDLDASPLQAGRVCHVYWPGDSQLGAVASAASYPLQIPRAKRTAELLLDYLEELAAIRALEVFLICHSLGSRVGLEVLHGFARRPPPRPRIRFLGASLMAAAVPVGMVEGALRPAAERIQRSLILFSEDDPVLQWAFPAGQTAGGEGLFPRAVGRFGEPGRGLWSERRDMAPYAHGDYWGGGRSAAEARRLVGLARERAVPAHATPTHALADAPAVRARGLPERALEGGRPSCC